MPLPFRLTLRVPAHPAEIRQVLLGVMEEPLWSDQRLAGVDSPVVFRTERDPVLGGVPASVAPVDDMVRFQLPETLTDRGGRTAGTVPVEDGLAPQTPRSKDPGRRSRS